MTFKNILSALGLRRRRVFVAPTPLRDEEIIRAINSWILACAVGAENGSTGSWIDFNMWLRASRGNWMPRARAFTGASEEQVEKALRAFVAANKARDYLEVLARLETERGLKPSVVLAPGESKAA